MLTYITTAVLLEMSVDDDSGPVIHEETVADPQFSPVSTNHESSICCHFQDGVVLQ
jgi:hypothetical protein